MGSYYFIAALFAWVFIGGCVGALISRLTGRAEGEGAALGALLGPVGWAIQLCLEDQRPRCPECLGTIRAGARRCMHCGERLEAVEK